MPRTCPKGEIRVHRKSSNKYYCTKDRGKKGRTPKQARVLPDIDDSESLKYKTNVSQAIRRKQLRAASKRMGTLAALRRLNLLRNYQATGSKAKKIMAEDVEYMKRLYATEKKKKSKKKSSKKKKKRSSRKRSKKSRKTIRKSSRKKSKTRRRRSRRK